MEISMSEETEIERIYAFSALYWHRKLADPFLQLTEEYILQRLALKNISQVRECNLVLLILIKIFNMGHQYSSMEKAEEEIKYLSENTDLTGMELKQLYLTFMKKDKVTKQEFLQQFKKTYPRYRGYPYCHLAIK